MSLQPYKYKGETVAVFLVQPSFPSVRIKEGEKEIEEIRIRVGGAVGMTQTLTSPDAVVNYDKKTRKIIDFSQRYKQFCCKTNCPIKQKNKKRKLIFTTIFLFLILCLFYIFIILPIHLAPHSIYPIPGCKTPDQIDVPQPHFTVEWYNLNHKVWWTVSDFKDTAYGRWELQRNKVFGNFRIVDPYNRTRSWGTRTELVPIFDKLKQELEEVCPVQDR